MEDKYRKILAEVVFFGITPALAATINSAAPLNAYNTAENGSHNQPDNHHYIFIIL